MPVVIGLLQLVAAIGWLVCFIMVIIKMCQRDATALAIVSLLMLILCGIGAVVVFIYGWIKAAEWEITRVMLIWTACFIGGTVLALAQIVMWDVVLTRPV